MEEAGSLHLARLARAYVTAVLLSGLCPRAKVSLLYSNSFTPTDSTTACLVFKRDDTWVVGSSSLHVMESRICLT